MSRKTITIVIACSGLLFGLVVALGSIGFTFFKSKPDKQTILQFIKENPEKSSIKLSRNDTILVSLNTDQIMPLASTVKLVVAVEYAVQAASGAILPDEQVPLSELEKYYIKNTDGGAHEQWIKTFGESPRTTTIKDIVIGMLRYSSNANTEWMKDRLGLEIVNARLDSLGMKNHSKIFYMVSSLLIGKEEFGSLSGDELLTRWMNLSEEENYLASVRIHDILKRDSAGNYKSDIGDLSKPVQKVWSDKLPASSTNEYWGLMKKINSRNFLKPKAQVHLEEVLEWIMKNPTVNKQYEHMGMKGGSTLFVMTKALYATDKKGNRTELAYFFNNLTPSESSKIHASMGEFERALLGDSKFREELKSIQ